MGNGELSEGTAVQELALRGKTERALTPAEFYRLADVPPEMEWFGNLRNRHTRKSYANDIKEFMAFAGIQEAQAFHWHPVRNT